MSAVTAAAVAVVAVIAVVEEAVETVEIVVGEGDAMIMIVTVGQAYRKSLHVQVLLEILIVIASTCTIH